MMSTKTLIEDGCNGKVFLMTPDVVERFIRKQGQQPQHGSGKVTDKTEFMEYSANQQKYKEEDKYPRIEDAPLLAKLKTWEGLGVDNIISEYYRYKQYERLIKDYIKDGIPLPPETTIETTKLLPNWDLVT